MFRLATNHLYPGMTVARNVYNASGALLLANNVTLDANLIFRLSALGVDSIYVRHPYLDVEPEDILHETTRIETINQTRKAFNNFHKHRTINLLDIQGIVKKIVEDAVDNRHMLINLTDIRTHDDYTFGHSINVCLLSVMIGIKIHLKEQQLMDLAMGAILHDLGKMAVPGEILNKPGELTGEEWRIIKEHADAGFEILRKQGELSLVSAHVAYQHHENYDGSGYSRGLCGEEIHPCARIAAIADLYDAITSDRPYRKAFLPHEAYEIILGSRGTKLDPQLTDVFLDNVALYPAGSTILLDTGEIGVVVNTLPKLQTRPVVKVIIDERGLPRQGNDKIIDLTKELTRFVVRVFEPREISQLQALRMES